MTTAPTPSPSRFGHLFREAHDDFVCGIFAWRLWLGLGVQDIRIRYRRTLLGPWWITASQAATFVCMGMLFSAVLKNDVRVYLPYLAAGMVIWNFVGNMAHEGPRVFVDSRHIITSLRLPLLVHVLRSSLRNMLIFLHNFSAAVAVSLILGGKVTVDALWLLVTLPLLFAILSAAALLLAIVGARFRDLGPVIGIAVQLGFFMTPIMWRPEDIPNASKWWVAINPAYHLVEVVRSPMLGASPPPASLAVVVGVALLLGLAAYLLFCGLRHRVAYWL